MRLDTDSYLKSVKKMQNQFYFACRILYTDGIAKD